MKKGDIILISFPFTDMTSTKFRPAVVLAENVYDVTVCFITSQVNLIESTDVLIQPNTQNGLRKVSLIKANKLATIDKKLAKGLLGKLLSEEIDHLNKNLKLFLQMP